jgi:hypothetical protein
MTAAVALRSVALGLLAGLGLVGPAAASVPEWVARTAPGTWTTISRNTLADVDPADDPKLNPNHPRSAPWRGSTGQASVIDAWNGGAFAPDLGRYGSLLLYGGGHGNYFGNEVYAFDLESGRWSRLSDPYVASTEQLVARYEQGAFPDGSPLPPHTYDYVEYDPGTRRMLVLRGLQQLRVPGNGVSAGSPHAFDLASRRWLRGATHGAPVISGGFSAYDPVKRVHWTASPGKASAGLRWFDAAPRNPDGTIGAWSERIADVPLTADSVAAIDPQRRLLVYTRFRKGSDIFVLDLTVARPRAVRISHAGDVPTFESAHGWEWSPSRGSFLYWRRGAGVYELRLDGSDPVRGRWVWSQLAAPGSEGPAEMRRDNGVYGRFRVASIEGREFALVVNGTDQPVHAFRVPPAASRAQE